MSCFDLVHKPRNNASFRFFAVGKGRISKGVARPRKDRNLSSETASEEQPALAVFFEKGNGHSLQWAESGFRSFSPCPVPFFDADQRSRKNRNDGA